MIGAEVAEERQSEEGSAERERIHCLGVMIEWMSG